MSNSRRTQSILAPETKRAVVTQLKAMERELSAAAQEKGMR